MARTCRIDQMFGNNRGVIGWHAVAVQHINRQLARIGKAEMHRWSPLFRLS
jgi:hypothetical protein